MREGEFVEAGHGLTVYVRSIDQNGLLRQPFIHVQGPRGAMVYAALFYAMLSGSGLGGAVVMAGFGLGTLPMLIGTGLGLPLLRRRATSVWLRNAVGVAIIHGVHCR